MPAGVPQWQRAGQARRAGHAAAGAAGRASALRAHHRAARRRGGGAGPGHGPCRQRGCAAPGAGAHRRGGQCGLEARVARWSRPSCNCTAGARGAASSSCANVGPITAGAVVATVPDATLFRHGCLFGAWLGKRCQTVARACALVSNGWSGYCRAAHPTGRLEAITSRPLLMATMGRAAALRQQPDRPCRRAAKAVADAGGDGATGGSRIRQLLAPPPPSTDDDQQLVLP